MFTWRFFCDEENQKQISVDRALAAVGDATGCLRRSLRIWTSFTSTNLRKRRTDPLLNIGVAL